MTYSFTAVAANNLSNTKRQLGLYEFKTLLTSQAHEISRYMIQFVHSYIEHNVTIAPGETYDLENGDDVLNFKQFRVFLDLNPFLRTMFLQALNP
jgi:hypothetical protein